MATKAPKKTTAGTAAKPQAATAAVLTCPECGRTFTRAAAMGAHRSRIHGVAGSSQNARRKRTTTAAAKPATPTKRASTPRPAAGNGRSPGNGRIDRDALLKTLFPNGIPARQDAIVAVNDWLNEADRLSRL
jgi:hypothetical protein